MRERGVQAADGLPGRLVIIGISLGVMPAQQLAQTRPGVAGAVLISSAVPPTDFADTWPCRDPGRIDGMDADPIFIGEGDIEAARELVDMADDAELIVHPGDAHLLVEYDEMLGDPVRRAVTDSVLEFLRVHG